jgi:hypothetical protein
VRLPLTDHPAARHQEKVMNRTTLAIIAGIGIALFGTAGAAERQSLDAVKVNSSGLDCTPPNASDVCSAWHAQIRRSFTQREIGMLFGARTSYSEYRTSYSQVKERYDRLQNDFASTYQSSGAVAAK